MEHTTVRKPALLRRIKLPLVGVIALILSLFTLAFIPVNNIASAGVTTIPDQIMVQTVAGVNINQINTSYGTSTITQLDTDNTYLLSANSKPVDSLVTSMSADPRIALAEPNYQVSITEAATRYIFFDAGSVTKGGGASSPAAKTKAKTQWAFSNIKLASAQLNSLGTGVVVAVVDSGVSTSHPDLQGKLLAGYNAINNTASVSDDFGHGTFVAGVITLVAPGAKVLPVKVLGSAGYGTLADAVEGIEWAADHGATVINTSFGIYTPSKSLSKAVKYAQDRGALVVASAGNENSTNPRFPAAYKEVIDVAATDQLNMKASFSNYGLPVKVAAPGVQLYSMWYQGGYAYGDGTSFATPLVAGQAALIRAQQPTLAAQDVTAKISNTAMSLLGIDFIYGPSLGKGLINTAASVSP